MRTTKPPADPLAPLRGARTSTPAADLDALCLAYAARMPEGQYFSHTTAAQLWRLPLPRHIEAERTLHVSAAPGSREPRMRGIRGHRGAENARVARLGLLALSSACDAWCQLGAFLGVDDLVVAGDRLVGWPRPLTTLAELDQAIARFERRRGAHAIHRARALIRERSASPRETRLRLGILRGGFPDAELNGQIRLPDGKQTHGDIVYRRYRVVFEYDGEQHRVDDQQYWTDVERLNALALDGWLVIRVGKHTTDEEALSLLTQALRSRGWVAV